MTSFLEGLWLSTSQVFWMNDPLRLEAARKKVLQLQVAAELGFLIPRTIITNNPDEVLEFYNTCSDGIVFKALYREFLDYGGGKGFNIPTTLITARHLQNLGMIKKIPSQFQEFIEKSAEVRVTIIGENIFSVLIAPRDTPPVDVDWRHPSVMQKLSYTETDLPPHVETFCRTVMKKLGLTFGAFDFIISKNEEWYFLEVNPNGQWYYCEEWAGVLISDAIVAILTLLPSG